MKRYLAIFSILSILIAGVFCYQQLQNMGMGCHDTQDSIICFSVVEHDSVMNTVIVAFIYIFAILVFTKTHKLVAVSLTKDNPPISLNILSVISPISIAISNGIVHPRIP